MIVVSGLPRSGNNLVRETILRCRRRAPDRVRQDEKVVIWHGVAAEPVWGSTLRFVIPVRDPVCRRLSMRRGNMRLEQWPEDECMAKVFRKVADTQSPVKLVSYEALVADPDAVAGDFIEWLGLPWVPIPTGHTMSPSRPADGPIYDGNAKYTTDDKR